MFYIFNQPIESDKPGKWILLDKQNKQDDGTVTYSYKDGSVLSIQPDGSWGTRPAGSNGQYEKATVNGNLTTYDPNNGSEQPLSYLTVESKITSL